MIRRGMVTAILAVALTGVLAAPTIAAGAAARPAKAHHHKRKRKGKRKAGADLKVTGGTVTLTLEPQLAGGFAKHGIATEALAPGQLGTGGSVSLPIASGTISRSTGYGSLKLTGGYSYQESSSVFFSAQDLVLSLENGGMVAGTVEINKTRHSNFGYLVLKGIEKPVVQGTTLTIPGVVAHVTLGEEGKEEAAFFNRHVGESLFSEDGAFYEVTISATQNASK